MTVGIKERKNSLNIAKILSQGSIEKDSVLQIANVAQSTFYKHLKVIRDAGFEVKNKNNRFKMTTYKKEYLFSQNELNIFCYLLMIAQITLPEYKINEFKSAIDEILSLSTKEMALEFEEKYESYKMATIAEYYGEKIEAIKKYFTTEKQIIIITKKKKEIFLKPLNFEWKKDKIYLKYKDSENEIKNIALNEIVKVTEKERNKSFMKEKEVVFELYGRLADCYLLKDNERVIEGTKEKLVIANSDKDKDELFRRLLKYDTLCKVIFPAEDVEDIKNRIEKSLANLNEI